MAVLSASRLPLIILIQKLQQNRTDEIWEWISSGAAVYVCGDAKRMAADVDCALTEIIAEQGKLNPEQAKVFVSNLAKNRRYLRDVY